MPIYVQIFLLVVVFIVFVLGAMYVTGLGLRRVCFKIIAELEEARAVSPGKAVRLQDERKNFFRVGTRNLRPKALSVLLADGLVIKAGNGKYYLDREKIAEMKSKAGKS